MAEEFDAYYRWLGIPPEEQPPCHYRLLGIKPFEDHADIIETSADRQMGHLRTFQTGVHGALSQKLLNEVAAAKLCLLNPEKKAAYDEALRRSLAPQPASAVTLTPLEIHIGQVPARPARPSAQGGRNVGLAVAAVVGLAAVGATVYLSVSSRMPRPAHRQVARSTPPSGPEAKPPAPAIPTETPKPAALPGLPPPVAEPKPEPEKPMPAPEPAPPAEAPVAKPEPPAPAPVKPSPAPASVAAAGPGRKWSVPDAAAQERIRPQLTEVFKLTEVRSPEDKLARAKEILGRIDEPKLTPEERFVMLRVAADLASAGDDAALMLHCVDEIGKAFECDLLAARVTYLAGFAEKVADPARMQSAFELSRDAMEEALDADRLDLVQTLCAALARACVRPAGEPLRAEVRQRREELDLLSRHWDEVHQAQETLKRSPDDPAANELVGQWICLLKWRWAAGLPYLVKAQDPALKRLAEEESRTPAAPEHRLALANGWWDLGKKGKPISRDHAMFRAGHWYRRAEPGLKDDGQRAAVLKRLDEIGRLDGTAVETRPGKPFVNSVGMAMVPLATGAFPMGSSPQDIAWCLEYMRTHYAPSSHESEGRKIRAEGPSHTVRIESPFYLANREVAQSQYEAVMGRNPSKFTASPAPGEDRRLLPVESVSWLDAREFCRRLSQMPAERAARREYRLPSEAEWEYACRAGRTGHGEFSSKGMWYGSSSNDSTHQVGLGKPNPWGFYDMLGNVAEWCANRSEQDYFRQRSADPDPNSADARRTLRGGSWRDSSLACRYAARDFLPAGMRRAEIGFRVACVAHIGRPRPGAERALADERKGTPEQAGTP